MLDYVTLHRARRVQLHAEDLLRQHRRRPVRPAGRPAGASRSASSTAPKSGYDSPDALINSGNTTGNARTATNGGYYARRGLPRTGDPGAGRPAVRQAARLQRGDPLLGLQQLRRHAQQQVRFPLEADRRPDGPRQLVGRLPRAVDRRAVRRPGRLVPDAERSLQRRQLRQPDADRAGPLPRRRRAGGRLRPGQPADPHHRRRQPEPAARRTSESKTLGFVYSPSWVEGLDISLDWWKIKIEDAITTIGGANIIQQCVDSGGTGPTCALYHAVRPDGDIQTLLNTTTEHRWHARSKVTT